MRPPCSTRPIIFGFILAIGITLTLPHFAFGAARFFGGSGRFRGSTIQRQHFISPSFAALDSTAVDSTASAVDFWVGVESSTSSQSSLFSSFNLQQPNLV